MSVYAGPRRKHLNVETEPGSWTAGGSERFLAIPELEMARVQKRQVAFCDRVPPRARDLVLARPARARQTDHGIRATPRMESQPLRGPYCARGLDQMRARRIKVSVKASRK
jgi:hypothetical protein